MRFIGLVLVLISIAVAYFLGFKGMTFSQARDRVAQLLNLPGLKTPSSTAGGAPTSPATAAQGLSGLAPSASAGAGIAGGGGGSW